MADPVWTVVVFDLPVTTTEYRQAANRFRHLLYDLGFSRVQLSIYAQYLPNATSTVPLKAAIRQGLPDVGDVRILRLTDAQWVGSDRFRGRREVRDRDANEGQQLMLFDSEPDREMSEEQPDIEAFPECSLEDDEW